MAEASILSLVHEVDINRRRYISWDDFTTFLIHFYSRDISSIYINRIVPLCFTPSPIPSSVQHIHYLPSTILSAHLIVVSSQSKLYFYHASTLVLLKEVSYTDKMTLHYQRIQQIHDVHQKAKLIKQKPPNRKHQQAVILCMAVLPVTYHICIGTSDHMITVYEVQKSIQVCANFSKLKHPPTFIHSYLFEETQLIGNQEKCESFRRIVVGDALGSITILNFDTSGVSSIVKTVHPMECIHRARFHSERVTGGAYIPAFLTLVSSSIDGTLVFMDPRSYVEQRRFNGKISFTNASLLCF